jgi:hypothetical protein
VSYATPSSKSQPVNGLRGLASEAIGEREAIGI